MAMPPLPAPGVLASWLRALSESLWTVGGEPGFVSLRLWPRTWELALDDGEGYGRVVVRAPREGFDGHQAARLLLHAAREGELANGSYEPAEERHAWIARRAEVAERCRRLVKRDRRWRV